MELISLSLLSNSHFRCDVRWLTVDGAAAIRFAYSRFTFWLCVVVVDEPVYCILRWWASRRTGFFSSLVVVVVVSRLRCLEMSWDPFCARFRFSVVVLSADSFFSLPFVNQNWNSILLNRFLARRQAARFNFFFFFLLLFVLPPLIRTRQASIIFSWGRKYNCLCRRCWFSPRLLFPRYSIHGCKEMKAEKGN